MNAARNLVTNGSASYVLRVKPGNDKFYICATATLCGPVTLYEYEKIGLEVPGAGTSSKPSGTNNLASGKKDPCATERDALLVASVKARMAWSKLQSVRSAIEELNREWENRRQEAYWSGTLDVAMMAGSVLTRPIAAAFGKEALLKQIVPAAIIESTFKGIAKESLKQFNKYCHDRSLDPSGVIADIAEKGWDSGSRVLVDFAMREIAMQMMDDVSGEKMSPAFRDLLTEEFFKPAAQFAGFMVSLQSALDSAWTAHGKLEDLRLAIKGLRDLETLDARKWEQRMSDLDVARSSVNHCQTIHPESTPDAQTNAVADFHPESLTGGSSQPLRRTAETNPAPPAKGTSVPGSGPNLVLPYNTASLGLRDGAVIVTNINADDYYYSKQGLVAGSRLISVNFQPLSVRTLEDLKKLLTPAGQDMVVLEFLRPDGTKINFPIPVQK